MIKNKLFITLAFALLPLPLVWSAITKSVTAQLSPDEPVRVTSNEITNSWNADQKASSYFYTFTASPGELNIILETLGSKGTGTVEVKLLNKNWEEIGTVTELVDTTNQGSKLQRIGRTFKITQPQELIIQVDSQNYYPHEPKYSPFMGNFKVLLKINVVPPTQK